MSWTTRRTIAALTPLALVFWLAACGSGGPADDEAGAAGTTESAEPAVDPATAATITGSIAFEGSAPARQPIDMADEPTCAEQHADGALTEEVVVNDGALANVFVYVKEGLEGQSFPTPSEPAVLDQVGCVYTPHVIGVQAGQTLTLRNSDGLLHNINANPEQNRGFNISQPTSMESSRSFPVAEVMIPVRCDVHGWMQAYIGVLDHPYHAVSGADGSFTLANLPPGEYVVEAWHERYGVQTTNVSIGESETQEISFTYSESMAENAEVPLADPIDLHDHGGSAPHAADGR